MEKPGKRQRSKLPLWVMRGLGFILLIGLVRSVDLNELALVWQQADFIWLLMAVFLATLVMLPKVQRWRCLLKAQGILLPFIEAFVAYLGAYYIGIVTPGRVGEIVKVFYLQEKHISMGNALVSVIVDRMLDLSVLLLFSLIGASFITKFTIFSELLLWGWLIVFVGAGGLFVLVRTRITKIIVLWLKKGLSMVAGDHSSHLDDFILGLKQIAHGPVVLTNLMLSVFSWLLVFCSCYLVANSLSIGVSFWYLSAAVAIGSVAALLPFSIAGIGLRDSAIVFALGLVNVSQKRALAFSVLYFIIFGVFLGLIGALCWYHRPVEIRRR